MKTETITVSRYEAGDVLDVSEWLPRLTQKKNIITGVKRGIVFHANRLRSGEYTYTLVLDNGKPINMIPSDQGTEKYIGHVDMSLLYGD